MVDCSTVDILLLKKDIWYVARGLVRQYTSKFEAGFASVRIK